MLRVFGIYTLLLIGIWVFEGAEIESRGTVVRADLLTFIYPLGAAVTGALFALMEPLADRSRVAAMAVGIIAIIPWMYGISLSMDRGYADWTLLHTILTVSTILIFGCALGYGYSKVSLP